MKHSEKKNKRGVLSILRNWRKRTERSGCKKKCGKVCRSAKEVERLEDRVFSLKKGEKKVEQLQMLPAVVASQCKSQQDELRERERRKTDTFEVCRLVIGSAAREALPKTKYGKKRKIC